MYLQVLSFYLEVQEYLNQTLFGQGKITVYNTELQCIVKYTGLNLFQYYYMYIPSGFSIFLGSAGILESDSVYIDGKL